MNDIALGTAAFVGLLGVAVIVAIVAERVRVPAAVALVAFGALVSSARPIDLPFAFGDTLLFVFLPPLIFEAAWNIDLGALRRVAWSIAVLAFPGVIVTTGVIALGVSATGQLPLLAAFMLGAIVSATDPVAVIAIFRRLGVSADLRTLVEGESVANDGVAIALYGIGLALAAQSTRVDALGLAWHGIVSMIVGVAIGIAAAGLIGLAMRGTTDPRAELSATIVLAYLAYSIATALDASGVFATAAAGITINALRARVLTAQSPEDVDRFWAALAFIANAFVFLATGLVIQAQRIFHEPLLVLVAIAVVFAARGVLAFGVLPLLGIGTALPGWRTTTFIAGMRGALSLALALGLPATFAHRPEIIDVTFAIVLVTLVVQGFSIEPVLKRLPIALRG